jgi:hypothetical protein
MTNQITTQVSVSETALQVSIHDPRPEAVQTLASMNDIQQEQLAHEAWLIGYRAVTNAHRLAEEARLNDIGKTLLDDIDLQLRGHAERQADRVQTALSTYFDPESGQVGERLRQLVGDGGTLSTLLDRHLGPQNSILVDTLVRHVGEQSPLFKKLSPTDSEGLLQLMAERLRKVMEEQNQAFHKALDPKSEGGAIAGFIGSLRDELKRAEDDQAEQLKIALAALDTTKEDSLLNQLRRDTQQAREQLLRAINPAAEGSPLALIHTSLLERLERHAKSQQEQLEEARKLATDFQRDVREAVQRIELRRRDELRSSRGGRLFEDDVIDFVQQSVGANGYIVENTGATVGSVPACKTGDAVIHYPLDHAFRDECIVVEAKQDKSYTITVALQELERARANRGAGVGIFVMAKSHAAPGFPTFSRYGQDVLVTWDVDGPVTDPYLQGALMVGLALAIRHRSGAAEGDLQALQGIEQRITKEVERLGEIQEAAEKIRKQVDAIDKLAATGGQKLQKLLRDAKDTLLALKVELREEEVERSSPIALTLPANDALAPPECSISAEWPSKGNSTARPACSPSINSAL